MRPVWVDYSAGKPRLAYQLLDILKSSPTGQSVFFNFLDQIIGFRINSLRCF